jgi:prepilin-type N-terminal cleavage/methylation domain-containing protein
MHTTHIPPTTARAGIPPAAIKRPAATAGIPPAPIKALSASAGIPSARRPAFTLVELLVVIVILAMLASLITVASMRGMSTARNARIKAEIDMLHMAIMSYKNEYGTLPPCADASGYASAATSVAVKHVARLFPRCGNVPAQFTAISAPALNPANALVAWLSGYTNDPTSPLAPVAARQARFNFDKSRLDSQQLVFYASGKPSSPCIYIQVAEYANSWPSSPFNYTVGTTTYTIPANAYFAQPTTGKYVSGGPYANPDSFQILSAGQDETFGTDDDLSNFWPSTRKEYVDSLNQ